MIPFTPSRRFDGDSDPVALADQLLALLDESPHRRALLEMPLDHTSPDELVDGYEERISTAYEIAKARRPDLVVRLHYAKLTPSSPPRLLVEIHEHKWIDGACVRHCGKTRETPDA